MRLVTPAAEARGRQVVLDCGLTLSAKSMEGAEEGRSLSMETFIQVAEAGVSSPKFTALCSWLVSELRTLVPLEEDVNPTHGPEDAETFQIEISGLLSELCCPYTSLTTGSVTTRLSTPERCLHLLYFLSSELLAARLQARKKLSLPGEGDRTSEAMHELQQICLALGMPEPDPVSPIHQVMADIKSQCTDVYGLREDAYGHLQMLSTFISDLLSALPPHHQQMAPLLKAPLTSKDWEELERIQKVLCTEYQCRKRMMITRLDVTIASFHWSERAKAHGLSMQEALEPLRRSLAEDSAITLAHLLAVREDFSRIVKTSSGASRDKTSCAINKVLMTGSVPDRGGRPGEIEPPMPIWEKRREGGDSRHQWRDKRSKKKKKK